MRLATVSLAFASATLAAAGQLAAQVGQACRAVATPTGPVIVTTTRPFSGLYHGSATDALLWQFTDEASIPASAAIAPASNSAWVGQQLNNARLQRFEISGTGMPASEIPGVQIVGNPADVAAAHNADLAVFLQYASMNGPFVLTAYRSTSTTPIWTYSAAANNQIAGPQNVRVSRDGSTVMLGVADGFTYVTTLVALDGATGHERSRWSGDHALIDSVDCTDDGSLALVAQSVPSTSTGYLIDTATGAVVTTFTGTGRHARYQISGDGRVVVIGGADFRVFVRNGSSYQQQITFTEPGSWFGYGSAVSRDGSTVGVLSHGSDFLSTAVRIWDVPSGQLLGTATTTSAGMLQDLSVAGVLSDDGSRFAVASWGDQGYSHPQTRLFDRNANLIDSVTSNGSPFALDLSGDGRYLLIGAKSVHANITGEGGDVFLVDEGPTAPACYANCDLSTSIPFLNVNDFLCFQSKFASGDTYANCDQSTTPPILNVNDFLCFQTRFAAGCSAP